VKFITGEETSATSFMVADSRPGVRYAANKQMDITGASSPHSPIKN